jgi:predicted dehydrogenase
MQMWLYGSGGGAHWPSCKISESNYQTKQLINRQLLLTQDERRPHHQEIVEFVQAIVDGNPSPVPAEQSLQVAQILEATYESQRTGGEVRIN